MGTTQISFSEFENELTFIEGLPFSHMDTYGQKIDLHFGEYKQTEDGHPRGEFVLYVSGYWEVLLSGNTVLAESFSQQDIVNFFNKIVGTTVTSVKVFEHQPEAFIELSSDHVLHFTIEQETDRWIELLKANGEIIDCQENKFYITIYNPT